MAEEKIIVPSDKKEVSKKVAVELEVDTSVKDLGPNPYAKLIHMARAVDAWRIFPRIFLTVYIVLLYKCVIWYMNLLNPTMEQSGLISVVVGVGQHGLVYMQEQVKAKNNGIRGTKFNVPIVVIFQQVW